MLFSRRLFVFVLILTVSLCCLVPRSLADGAEDDVIAVLVISGLNNHNWKQTTPMLVGILEANESFKAEVTEQPGELTVERLKRFDVILSNYNAFGNKTGKKLWSAEAREAYVDFVREGGGHVVVHAGSAGFFDWEAYQQLSISTWKLGETGHGRQHAFAVRIDEQEHPITRGLSPFLIYDELWHRIPVPDDATVLMSGYSSERFNGTSRWEPTLLVSRFGQGRTVFNVLGHDAKKMEHPGFKSVLQRSVEWAATGKVTLPPPRHLPTTPEQLKRDKLMPNSADVSAPPQNPFATQGKEPSNTNEEVYRWRKDEQTLALLRGDEVVWQFNANERIGKPYFHPLRVPGGPALTRVNPPDHIWHYGLWFCWKYINGVNYWEENREHVSAGRTDLLEWSERVRADGGARIEMRLAYHPPGAAPVMTEKRVVEVTPPDSDGAFALDWDCTFTAGDADVELSRTPLPGEQGGKAWGGYAGLSLRLTQQFIDRQVMMLHGTAAFEGRSNYQGRSSAMDFSGMIDGKAYGVAILDHPNNLNAPTPVYAIRDRVMNFISPAVICLEPHVLKAGQSMTLRYRVVVHPGRWNALQLKDAVEAYAGRAASQ